MSKILIYSLGGTIAMTSVGPGGSIVPTLSAAELASYLPAQLLKGIDIEGRSFRQLSGSSIGFGDLTALLREMRQAAQGGITGFVVTMGTDSIEEASFLIDLLWDCEQPIVVTGAMRGPSHISPDGAFNLAAAVATASSPQARGRGCLVVLNDEIHCARWVRKIHTTSGNAFSSGIVGTAGVLIEDEVRFLQPPLRQPVYPLPDLTAVKTALIVSVVGDDGTLYTKLDDGSFDGVVIAGFGAGHVPAAAVDAIDKLARRIPVVLATRVDSGPTLRRTYGYPGSEVDLLGRGLVCADLLDALKARLLLHVLIANGMSRDAIESAFATHG
ncbi:asparaginase [Rhizocola hellebori]|uniref:asparaginase n=1 Tax=Rhizocola hellebori TaxID=1392758 RepID=UPI001940D7CF|nr:asparaginase [Rhizocola hellebori]